MACPVSTVQAGLNITADGVVGPQTRQAVATLQGAIGANADGYYWTSSGAVGPNTGSHVAVIQQGVRTQADQCYGPGTNGAVRAAQNLLGIPADGFYGPQTHGAVVDFQQRNGLAADGILGPITGNALFGGAPAPGPPPPGPGGVVAGAGIDVSGVQGSIDWGAFRGWGNWAGVKASEGQDFRDPMWSPARVNDMRAHGVGIMPYHFLRPRAGRTGDVEARFFLDVIRSAGWGQPGDMMPCVDFEATALGRHRSKDEHEKQLRDLAELEGVSVKDVKASLQGAVPGRAKQGAATYAYLRQFSDFLRGAGFAVPVCYTSPSFWVSWTPGPQGDTDSGGMALWVASWFISAPQIPVAWNHWDGWQYADNGRVPGVGSVVDLDAANSLPRL